MIYCNPVHPQAAEAIRFMSSHGIRFEQRDITTSAYWAEHVLKATGQNEVPLIEYRGKAVTGFAGNSKRQLTADFKVIG